MRFSEFETFIFDLDGTIWYYPRILPHVKNLINSLSKLGKKKIFATNFTLLSRKETVRTLRKAGLKIKEEEIINPTRIIAEKLKNKKVRVMVIGDGMKKDLKSSGIRVVDKPPADYLVVGHDMEFNREKLSRAINCVKGGAKFFTAAMGKRWIMKNKVVAGTGAIVKAIEHGSNQKAELFGKPSLHMQKAIKQKNSSPARKTVLFGDEVADVITGKKLDYSTVFVRSGVEKTVKGKIKPDFVVNSLADVKI